MYRLSVIIPTYHRLEDLTRAIGSILVQSRLPEELIIVDDGDLPDVPLKVKCEEKGISVIYHKKDNPGLTASRNKGIRLASGDLIIFFDDDVELHQDYLKYMEQLFIDDTSGDVGGASGITMNEKPLKLSNKIRNVFDRLFMVTGSVEGKVLPSGFCVNYGATGHVFEDVSEVDFLAGCGCAFRKKVFEKYQFNENYQGYGLGEDKDFSYRLIPEYKLKVTPFAKLNHYESPQMRYDTYRRGYEFVLSRHRFFKELVLKNPLQWFCFYYAITGYAIGRIIIFLMMPKKAEWDRLKGIFKGIGHVLTGKGYL
jgi:glucosyl-dolichyl phosphate glucuronosyltransferase